MIAKTIREEFHDYGIPVEERPPLAVVGSQIERDEQLFGRAFDKHVMRRFLPYLLPYKKTLLFALAAVFIFTVSQIAIPLIIRSAIDVAVIGRRASVKNLLTVVSAFLAAITVNYLANFFQDKVTSRVGERVLFDLRRSMFQHLQRVALSFMDKTEVGRLMARLQGDVYALQQFVESSVSAIGDLVLLIGIIVAMLIMHVKLGLMTLAIIPVLFAIRFTWLPRAREAFLGARQRSSSVNGALAEGINGVRTIQAMGREDVNYVLFDDKARENLKAQLKGARFAQIMIPIVDTLTGIAMAVVIIVGGNLVLSGALELGVMVAFIFFIQRFFAPIRSITLQYSVMQRAMASGQRIFEVMDVEIDVKDGENAEALREVQGDIIFENVTFGYEPDRPILKDISFHVRPGETVALVGPTGSGKTSITSLTHRFYDVWKGRILIDGIDLRTVTQESLGNAIAMVLQEPFLFTGTILENIRYRRTGATMEQVIAAAEAVGAHRFIRNLAEGYQTELEQGGGNLSRGQKQLLSFARALVADSPILVLDEATANIDSYTERVIQKALERLLEGRTALVIAHRLSTIRGADRIIVIQDGRIVESDTHEKLMERRGLYARLYTMNFASFDDMPKELINDLTGDQSRT